MGVLSSQVALVAVGQRSTLSPLVSLRLSSSGRGIDLGPYRSGSGEMMGVE